MHLLRVGATVHAASELGDHRALDLAAFERPRCELLRDVWEAVPVVWEGGSAKQAPKPLGHACAAVSP